MVINSDNFSSQVDILVSTSLPDVIATSAGMQTSLKIQFGRLCHFQESTFVVRVAWSVYTVLVGH